MARGKLADSAYAAHSMDPAFRVNRSPLLPERPRFSRRETEFFYDGSDDGEDDFYDSQEMPSYDDPAFSIDPRDNPHLMSRTDVSRMRTSPIPPNYSEFEGGNEERLAYRSHDSSQRKSRTRSRSPFPPQPPLTTSSPSGSYSSSSNEHSPFHGGSTTSHQTSVDHSRNVSPATSEKVDHIQVKPQKSVRNSPRGDLDKVDQLDVTDPFGFMRHHDGPYQTVNDALTKRTPLPKTHNEQRKPKVQVSLPTLFASTLWFDVTFTVSLATTSDTHPHLYLIHGRGSKLGAWPVDAENALPTRAASRLGLTASHGRSITHCPVS